MNYIKIKDQKHPIKVDARLLSYLGQLQGLKKLKLSQIQVALDIAVEDAPDIIYRAIATAYKYLDEEVAVDKEVVVSAVNENLLYYLQEFSRVATDDLGMGEPSEEVENAEVGN